MPRKPRPPRGPQLELAGDLAVAFVNTAGASEKNSQQGVASYRELLAWGRAVGTVSTAEAERLGERAAAEAERAAAAWGEARAVRSALFRLFLAVMAGEALPTADLDLVNRVIGRALAVARLVPGEQGLELGCAGDEDALDRVLWPVLVAAMQLLLSLEGRPHVRQCAGEGCRLFFVDRSPTGRRRWCERSCANRAKSLAFYYRTGRAERMRRMDKLYGKNRRRRRPDKK